MRREPEPHTRPEVEQHVLREQRTADLVRVRHVEGDGAAAVRRDPWRSDWHAELVGKAEHALGLTQRLLANRGHPDARYDAVSRQRRGDRGDPWRSGPEA